jgi:hypothetical protein
MGLLERNSLTWWVNVSLKAVLGRGVAYTDLELQPGPSCLLCGDYL